MRKLSKREEKRSTRSNRFMARMICFACLYRLKPQASTINEMHLNKTNHSSLPCTESWDWSAEAALCSFYALCFCALFLSCLFLFFLIRNFTMFSLVGKKNCTEKQRSSHWAVMFFSLIQFEASPTGTLYCLFFMLPWHLSCSESTLWNLWLKKKVISIPADMWWPQDTLLCFEPV